MGKMASCELDLLLDQIRGSKFIIETGSGESTHKLSQVIDADSLFYSIDILLIPKMMRAKGVIYRSGWTLTWDDFIKPGDDDFVECVRYDINGLPDRIAIGDPRKMKGEVDLIRKILAENKDKQLDFFFCDSGEYCGLAEWNIVKDIIKVGGKFACHDIYYPKSIKSFKILEKIEEDPNWILVNKTDSRKGLAVAQKVS